MDIMLTYVALLVATTVIQRVLAPKPKGTKAAALEDFSVPTAEVGRPIPWLFGTRKIKDPNCIWYGDLRTNRKKKDDGTFFWYYMGLHLEICIGPVDEIKRIWYGDKMCWDGSIAETTYGTVINQQNLYGGIRSEGGIWIAFDAMFGDADQPANAYMESQLGAPVSAFRDSLTLVFHQGIISANSAYVRPIMPLVQRIYAGWADECWFPETASIAAPIAAINPMHGELYREIMRHRPGLYIGFEEAPDEFGAFTGSITNWGSGQNGTYIGTLPRHGGIVPHGSQSVGCVTPNGGVTFPQNAKYSYTTNDVVMLACKLRLSQSFRSAAVDGRYYLWLEGRLQDANNHGLGALFILDDVNGDRLEVSYKGASDLDWNGAHIVLPEGTLTNGAEFFLALRITKTGGTHGTGMISLWLGCNATFVGSSSFPAKAITPTRDAVLVRIGHGSGGDVPDHPIYAEVDDFAIFTSHLAQSSIENLARAYCSDRDYDMNPAHIISNVWTDQHQGMAYDPAMIDDAAMRYCAQLLYDEEFGISLYWARQESIENFVAEVCRHADLLQSINPRTGQLRLIALRDDYDIEDLIEITEDDIIEIVEWQETASGEGTNTVTVTYEDRNGDQQAATYQNRAAALHYGVIAQTIDYPGITTAELAMRVAERECRKLGGNFAKGKIKCNRLPWDIMPGAVFVLSHGPEGIGPLVVRVLEWSGGTLTSGAITLNVVQDVFSLKHDVSRFFPQSGEWTAPDTAAAPCENETVQEMPYWMTRNVYGVAETSTMPVEAGYILALGTRPTPTTTDIDIWSGVPPAAVVQTAEDRGIVPTATLAAAIDYLDGTDIELADSVDLGDVQPGWLAQIGEGSGAEIVLVDSIDGQHIAITRGVLDTVPHQWPIGERLYFISSSPSEWPYSPVQYANGDDVAVKLQAGSRAGEIDIEEAASLSITMASRIARPYPPGAVKVNAIYFPSVWDDWSELEITWAHRDRIEQTAPVEWTAASIGPESGTTYTVQAYGIDEDGVETRFYQATGISGTTDTIDLDTYPLPVDAAIVSVRVWSVRDGLASWQHVATNIINLHAPTDLAAEYDA